MNIMICKIIMLLIFMGKLMGVEIEGFGYPVPQTTRSNLLDQIYVKLNKEIGDKYHLWLCGKGGKIQETIKIVTMEYNLTIVNPISRDDARAMIVNITEKYLHEFNQNEEIRSHLVEYPFSFKNFQITVYVYKNRNYDSFDPPELTLFAANLRGVTFYTQSLEEHYGFDKERESYEEALEKVKAQGKLDLPFIQS